MSDTELAWAAGFFDGEGNTSFCRNGSWKGRQYWRLTVQVGQSYSPETLERFQKAVGVGYITGPNVSNRGHADSWKFSIASEKAVSALRLLWPYLSSPKKEQAERAIERWLEYSDSLGTKILVS
jgi:hypothetical protein